MPDVSAAAGGWSRAYLELHNDAPAGTYHWKAGWTVNWNDANNWGLFWEWGLGGGFRPGDNALDIARADN
jgi:hypothetical protein